MIDKSDIAKMSIPERLKAMELLWESISDHPESIDSPNWHKDILNKRESRVDSGKTSYLTLSELKSRMKK
ncbi:addiction module protein [Rhodohalobacter mucosus]|nr:addiction module protein [Rhodohalobacter mucosus]